MYVIGHLQKLDKQEKEAIHSGQFMVSHFEAEQDDEDEIAVAIPEVPNKEICEKPAKPIFNHKVESQFKSFAQPQIAIDTNLSKLFQCMSLAYR